MRVLHLLASGEIGGIEVLCKDIGLKSHIQNDFCFLWKGGKLEKEMTNSGLTTYVVGISHTLSISAIKAYSSLLKIINKNNYDAMVFHHSAPLMWFYLPSIKRKYPKLKIFQYAHAHYDNLVMRGCRSYIVRKILFNKACKAADQIIAISTAVKNSIKNNTIVNEDKIRVIYNGVDISRFKNDRVNKNDKCKIIFVGRIMKGKGVQILINAMSQMKSVNYSVDVVGDGSYLGKLKELAKKLGIENKITFLGAQRDIPNRLKEGNIFVHPAIWEEGFGIAIVEAMAAGLVCVATNKGAIPEIIRNNEEGYLVESGNSKELAERLDILIGLYGTEKFTQIGQRAAIKASKFSIEHMVVKFDSYVQEI